MVKSEWDDWLNPPAQPWADHTSAAYMDGLRTEADYNDRRRVMQQCVGCAGWTEQEADGGQVPAPVPCAHCGELKFDPTSTTSVRSFNPLNAKKRKPKGKRK